ncbi:MAG: hypothetical protein KY433_07270 [Actinobacteria bacterium]|nr:hypothetical protein [Actinomycetota bacterium]
MSTSFVTKRVSLLVAARDDELLVVEPRAALLVEDFLRRLELPAAPADLVEALVLDLADIDHGVPRGRQRRRAERAAFARGRIKTACPSPARGVTRSLR